MYTDIHIYLYEYIAGHPATLPAACEPDRVGRSTPRPGPQPVSLPRAFIFFCPAPSQVRFQLFRGEFPQERATFGRISPCRSSWRREA